LSGLGYSRCPGVECEVSLSRWIKSDRERIHVADLFESISFVAFFGLRETGTVPRNTLPFKNSGV